MLGEYFCFGVGILLRQDQHFNLGMDDCLGNSSNGVYLYVQTILRPIYLLVEHSGTSLLAIACEWFSFGSWLSVLATIKARSYQINGYIMYNN